MTFLVLALASSLAWFISSLIGGGSPLILIPLISVVLSTSAIPPVITTGMLFGNAQRVLLYWQQVDWRVVAWCLPSASVGAVLGAFVISRTHIEWLSLLLACFLLTSVFGLVGQESSDPATATAKPSPRVKAWHFLPLGFGYAFFSGLIGSTGPILHPFYLGYGLTKEQLLATKSFNVLGVHLIKLIAYAGFGVLTLPYLGYGLLIGIAALPGNWLGQWALKQISEQRFRQLVVTFVTFSGLFMLWQQRTVFF